MSVRVLVVEDEELSAQAHADYVRRTAGFEVAGVARSAAEASRLLRSTRVDLVLLDMNLPDGHGLALLQGMRSDGFLCDVIAVTAARDLEVVKRAVAQGVVLYLLKPFTYAGFRTKLDQYADYRRRLTEEAQGAVAQEDVDRMLGVLRTPAQPVVTAEGDERGHAAGGHPGAARRHRPVGLGGRRRGGHLAGHRAALPGVPRRREVVERTVRYGGSGRPEVEYSRTGS